MKTTEDPSSDSEHDSASHPRLVLLLDRVEKHLGELYGSTVADFECDPKEEEGWILYCEVKGMKGEISKQNAESSHRTKNQSNYEKSE